MSNSTKPLISVVIPTRERADTLKFTLETALDQANDHFEIVISDNFSQDNTKEVVEGFSDSRIKYVNTGRRLSMCDNWDFALEHVSGDYVIYIGDDDGLMPGAINKLGEMIKTRPCPIYCWEPHEYLWPIEENFPKIVSITSIRCAYEIDLNKLVRFSLRWGGIRNGRLPRVYHAAVATSLLKIIHKTTGRVFHSQAPDIFTAYALPAFSNKAINLGVALTVTGYSGKSNSGVAIAKNGPENFQRFVLEYGDYKYHASLFPGAPNIINHIQDSVLVAMDLFPEFYAERKFNYDAMWAHMLWSDRYQIKPGTAENKLNSLFHLLRNRRQIRLYHPLRVTHFLFYIVVGALLKLRATLKRKVGYMKLGKVRCEDACPRDIYAFVKLNIF